MQVSKIIKTLVDFTVNKSGEEVVAFYMPSTGYKGYILVVEDMEVQTNSVNQYLIKGHVLKAIDLLNEEDSFNLVGVNYVEGLDYISFNSKKLTTQDIQSNIERGFVASCSFAAKITIPQTPSPELTSLNINLNNESNIIIENGD